MKRQPLLFKLDPDAPSKALQLDAFKKQHGILTHRSDAFKVDPDRWVALLPFSGDENRELLQLISDKCSLYDEADRMATGPGELTAVRRLCDLNGIKCEL